MALAVVHAMVSPVGQYLCNSPTMYICLPRGGPCNGVSWLVKCALTLQLSDISIADIRVTKCPYNWIANWLRLCRWLVMYMLRKMASPNHVVNRAGIFYYVLGIPADLMQRVQSNGCGLAWAPSFMVRQCGLHRQCIKDLSSICLDCVFSR